MKWEQERRRRRKFRSSNTKCSSGASVIAVVLAVLNLLAQCIMSNKQLGSFIIEIPIEIPIEIKSASDENHRMEENISLEAKESENHHHETVAVDGENFERVLWPQLQQKLCPSGLPELSLGPKLFELARTEFGIPAHPIQSKSDFASLFFNSASGSSLVVDGNDPDTSLLYVRIFKCANNQIRDYLVENFNQLPDPECANNQIRDYLGKKFNPFPDPECANNQIHDYLVKHFNQLPAPIQNDLKPIRPAFKKFMPDQRHHRLNTPWSNTTDSSNTRTGSRKYTFVDQGLRFFSTDSTQTNIDNSFFRYRGVSHKKPCVFTVMRDPISHFLSGYNEIEFRAISGYSHVSEQTLTFTKLPYKGSSETEVDPGTLRESRFEGFVRDLLEENPAFSEPLFQHAYPISSVLHKLNSVNMLPTTEDPSQQWILPSVSNLTETLVPFLADRCPRFVANYAGQQQQATSSGLPPVEVNPDRVHLSAGDPMGTYKAAKDVWKKGGRVARTLCTLHAFDYGCFYGDNVPSGTSLQASDIPLTCKNVFSSDIFREAILGS